MARPTFLLVLFICLFLTLGQGKITVWEHSNHRGASRSFHNDVPELGKEKTNCCWSFNDAVSSVKVDPGEEWELFTGDHYKGTRKLVRGNVPFVGHNMNERISSLKKINQDRGITLYSEFDYRGHTEYHTGSYDWLSQLNDRVYSAKVHGKNEAYLLLRDPNLKGDCHFINSDVGFLPDNVRDTSSIRKIRKDDGLVMWDHIYYRGQCEYRTGDVKDIRTKGVLNDKASSLKVLSGSWELYQHPEWRGNCFVFTKDTPVLPSGILDQVSSIRKVRRRPNNLCKRIGF